jgi:hypothetical protein|tara:strand:+ start:1501 stop:1692 length:192 start_codon:yes stop_codon:yes gene_type:complete
MNIGDLVRLVSYPSRFETLGQIGLVEEVTKNRTTGNEIAKVRFSDGQVSSKAHFCLEIISESG